MPAKGKYFFTENDGCKITDPLYEKYRYSSQQHPLLLFMVGIVFAYCVTLIVVLCVQDVSICFLFVFPLNKQAKIKGCISIKM